jgi:hypothetical protein
MDLPVGISTTTYRSLDLRPLAPFRYANLNYRRRWFHRSAHLRTLPGSIRNLAKSSSTIEYGAERPGDVKHSVAGVDKIQKAGFRPVCDLAGSLRATIEFLQQRH